MKSQPTNADLIVALGRIGPKMQSAIRYCAKHPAPSKHHLAQTVFDYSNYGPIERCIDRGLLELDPDHPAAAAQGSGAVVLTDAGERLVSMFVDDGSD